MISDIIEIVVGETNMAFDGEVLKAVRNVGINVDKDRLVEALQIAEKLVRCRECKYKRIYDDDEEKYYYCALEDRPNRQWSVDDTDYCSWGERDGE